MIEDLQPVKGKPGRPLKNPKPEPVVTSITPELLHQIQKELYKKSYYEFFKEAFKVLHNGEELIDNWHIEKICTKLQNHITRIKEKGRREKHLIINVPPRSLKSMLVSVVFPVYCLLIKPNVKIITASHSASLANKLNSKSRQLIKSEWFQSYFKEDVVVIKDNEDYYETSKGGERLAVGITTAILGSSADIIIGDDIQDTDDAASDAVRKTVISKFNESLSTRLNNKAVGLIINIQQRLHHEDITGHLLDKQGEFYELIKLPSEAYSENEVSPAEFYKFYSDNLFFNSDGYFSKEDLRQEKAKLGSKGYANMHLQKPSNEEAGIFKREWFNIIDELEFVRFLNGRKPVWNFFLDTASKDKSTNDASAFLVGCYIDNKLFIKDVQQRRLKFVELIKFFKEYIPLYYTPSSRIYIEDKASGTQLIQVLRSEGGYNVLDLNPGRDSKVVRANNVTPYVEGKNVFLLKGNYVEEFLEQITNFSDGKSGNDDMLDAFVYSCMKRSKGTGLFYQSI